MNRTTVISAVALSAVCAVLSACAPATRFEWGGYEQALYAYAQNPENRSVYRTSLEQAIERGERRDAVAPGMYAELGYLDLEDGQGERAIQNFRRERALFPESAVFMDRVIRQLGGTPAESGGQN
jgi:hypothetical protein